MNKSLVVVSILVLSMLFVFADNYSVGSITIPDDSPSVTPPSDTPVLNGQSVVYYLKSINANLFSQVSALPSVDDLKRDIEGKKGPISGSKPSEQASTSGGVTVTWSNILPTTDYDITFPASNGQTLKLSFTQSSWTAIKYIDVLVNNSPVDCYYNVYESVWNALGGKNTLVYGWGESKENCDYAVDGKYVVDTTLSKSGDYYDVSITSPIMPQSCKGKSFDAASSNGTTVTC